jgi:ASC-1-like (ASCH) protein
LPFKIKIKIIPEKPILKKDKPILTDQKIETQEIIKEFTLQRQYLKLIETGLKTAEGRINSGGFAKLEVGSKVKFFEKNNPKNYVICEVLEIKSYLTFREMLESEGVENMLPGITSLEEGVQIYEKISGYRERCQKSGCLGLKIRVLS